MKKLPLSILFLIICLNSWAQDFLLLEYNPPISVFTAATFEVGLEPNASVSIGGMVGIAKDNYFLGGFLTKAYYDEVYYLDAPWQKDVKMGGVVVGYTFPSNDIMHLYSSVKLGWGQAMLSGRGIKKVNYIDEKYIDDVFTINPEIGMELIITSWYRVAFTASYRIVRGVDDLAYLTNLDFSNYASAITFRFGNF